MEIGSLAGIQRSPVLCLGGAMAAEMKRAGFSSEGITGGMFCGRFLAVFTKIAIPRIMPTIKPVAPPNKAPSKPAAITIATEIIFEDVIPVNCFRTFCHHHRSSFFMLTDLMLRLVPLRYQSGAKEFITSTLRRIMINMNSHPIRSKRKAGRLSATLPHDRTKSARKGLAAGSKLNLLRQICNLIPERLVRCSHGGWHVAGAPFWEEI
jgi:hypothetical protein